MVCCRLAVEAPSLEALTNRVRRVCQDLACIEEQLSSKAKPDNEGVPGEAVPPEDMKALRVAIDETRAFLWSYFQGSASPRPERAQPAPGPEAAASPNVELPATRSIDSFFEEIQSLATRIVEKHMSPKDRPAEGD